MVATVIFLLVSSNDIDVYAKQIQNQYSKERRNSLFLKALSVIPEHKIPTEFRFLIFESSPPKCATIILEEVRQNLGMFSSEQKAILNKVFQRPSLPLSFVSSTGRFKIHFADQGSDAVPLDDVNSNSIPDFVEEVALAFENSHENEVEVLGYQMPPDDAGVDGPEYDIYLQDLGLGFYSFTQAEAEIPETPQDDMRSFTVLDNDFQNEHFTTGIQGALVSAAHEYFHAVQFGYRIFSNINEGFYYELCSTWIEDVIYDEINDYYQALPSFFQNTGIPFNLFDDASLKSFGESVWNHFLVKKYADFSVVRNTWEHMQLNLGVLDAIDQALNERGSNLLTDFTEFAVWNYFTGGRADSIAYYEESHAYPEIFLNGEVEIVSDTSIVDSSLSLTHKYYRLTNQSDQGFSIKFTQKEDDFWAFLIIFNPSISTSSLHFCNPLIEPDGHVLDSQSEVVLIPVNTRIIGGEDLPVLNNTYQTFKLEITPIPITGIDNEHSNLPSELKLNQNYPNPFNPETEISFQLPEANHVVIKIYNVRGEEIRTLTDGQYQVGGHQIRWDGKDNNGNLVPSGVYLYQLKSGSTTQIKKMTLIR